MNQLMLILLCTGLITSTACAQITIDFHVLYDANMLDSIQSNVAIFSAEDKRQEVVESKELSSWVGWVRTAVGIPWDIIIKNNESLTSISNKILQNKLREKGTYCKINNKNNGNKYYIKLIIDDFNSDAYSSVDLIWNISLKLYSNDSLVFKNSSKGSESLHSGFGLIRKGNRKIVDKFNQIIFQLANDEFINKINSIEK